MHLRDDIPGKGYHINEERQGAPRSLSRAAQLRILGVAMAAVILLIAGSALIHVLGPFSSKPAAPAEQLKPGTFKPTERQWATLTIKPVAAIEFHGERTTDGNIVFDDDLVTPVFSPYSGRVTRIIAKPGDLVRAGDPLFAIQASEFTQAESDLITAKAQFELAETNERRQHELYEARGAALKDWMQAQADLATATATLSSVRNRLRILGKSDAEITRLENASRGQAMNPESMVDAPIGGTVLQRQIGLGQFIQSGASSPVYSIGDLSKVWLIANVREADAGLMRVGESVDVQVLAFPGRVFKAKLDYVASAVDPNTHRLPVRAEVENPDQALKAQMFARFSISTGGARVSPAIPESAVIYEGDTARVWLAHDDHSLELRQIKPGRTMNDLVEVLEGLAAGDKVVTAGTLFIDRAASTG